MQLIEKMLIYVNNNIEGDSLSMLIKKIVNSTYFIKILIISILYYRTYLNGHFLSDVSP